MEYTDKILNVAQTIVAGMKCLQNPANLSMARRVVVHSSPSTKAPAPSSRLALTDAPTGTPAPSSRLALTDAPTGTPAPSSRLALTDAPTPSPTGTPAATPSSTLSASATTPGSPTATLSVGASHSATGTVSASGSASPPPTPAPAPAPAGAHAGAPPPPLALTGTPPPAPAKKDFYEVLGVSKNATTREISMAYKQKSLLHHPNKGGSVAEYHKVQEAYETLIDKGKRYAYDMYLKLVIKKGGRRNRVTINKRTNKKRRSTYRR